MVGLLDATLIARPPQITRELPSVLQVLTPLMQSPLAAPRIQQVFLDIGVCLMPKHLHSLGTRRVLVLCCIHRHSLSIFNQCQCFYLLAVLVGHVTLRLLKPECDLDEAWGQEDLDTAAHRTILLLHNHTVAQRDAKTGGEHSHGH